MSYDVDLYAMHEDSDIGVRVYHWTFTYNASPMLHEAGVELGTFNGQRAEECADTLRVGLDRLRAEPAAFRRYDWPPDGYERLVRALGSLLRAFGEHPGAIVRAG